MTLFSSACGILIYVAAIEIERRITTPATRKGPLFAAARLFARLVIAGSLASMALVTVGVLGNESARAAVESGPWSLSGYVIAGLAIAAFGIMARVPLPSEEPPAIRRLLKAYGACALIYAPMTLIEFAFERSGLRWLPYLSTDHLFYLAWNVVSMSAAVDFMRPSRSGIPMLDAVPEERARALGLSGREREMAVLIARGLANKEIASELGISPGTVRTHIYNLYQKAGARSRVELLNKLES